MNRRRFLTAVSATLPLSVAGCLGNGNDDDQQTSTGSPTTDEPTTSEPMKVGETADLSGETALTLLDGTAHASIIVGTEDGPEVAANEGKKWALLNFDADAVDDRQTLVSDSVTLTLNETDYTDPTFVARGGQNDFTAAYEVPADLSPWAGHVTVDTGDASATWQLDARTLEDMAHAVSYSVTSVSVPDSVARGDSYDVDVTVENAGSAAMRFLARLNPAGVSPTTVEFEVPQGETKTNTTTVTASVAEGTEEFDVSLDWGVDSTTKTIAVDSSSSSN
ncbi:hypothetical protein [Halobacterium zhouii]|uniref:hypothetical protein n=1 Tax=Halobacterium zhouii TaxID=2902624 RepID=UPI001E46FD72|nr:hypothetical protein [Halobacterium zhouii]